MRKTGVLMVVPSASETGQVPDKCNGNKQIKTPENETVPGYETKRQRNLFNRLDREVCHDGLS